ncbi:class I SAM-dependent methyltransferase [Pseudophaeobacter sp.]|uniref:class I SAM-dependent methyltransferase n=1 Tax=Pseudophaeobacter sp. TaxID=1971739 RepID=UPI00405889DB
MHPVTQLFDIIEGPIRFALVEWAIERGVFSACVQGKTAGDIALLTQSDEEKTLRVLKALVSLKMLGFRDDTFHTDPDWVPFLDDTSSQSLVQTFKDLSKTRHANLNAIGALAAGITPQMRKPSFDAAHWQRQQQSLSSFHKAVAGDAMLSALQTLPEWDGATSVLDIGGGSLELSQAIVQDNPNARVTLFDLPNMVEGLDTGGKPAIQTQAGDYNVLDTLPQGPFDIIWCSMSLYFARDLRGLFSALLDQLSPGGVLTSFHEDLDPDRCGPSRHVIGRLMPALGGKDVSFSGGYIADLMRQVGLQSITSQTIEAPFGPFRLDAGRK